MNKYNLFLLLLIFLIGSSCNEEEISSIQQSTETENTSFTVHAHYILKNNLPFHVKGIVYVPGYPGNLPWEIENSTTLSQELKDNIDLDLYSIKAMGANTVRFWGAPKY